MSDNSNSAGSSGSSTNSWTLLSPEEGEMENLGPVDDGTESLGDVPSLSEEVAGATGGIKSDEMLAEAVLSEEGQQVCQETSPEDSEGPIAVSPTGSSPFPPHFTLLPDLDPDSQPPVIHDIVTSSPSDNNEHLGATPFVTNIASGAPLAVHVAGPPLSEPEFEYDPEPELDPSPPVPDLPALDEPTDAAPPVVMETPVVAETPVVVETPVTVETLVTAEDPVLVGDRISPETVAPSDLPSRAAVTAAAEDGPPAERPADAPAERSIPETVGPAETAVPEPAVPEPAVPEPAAEEEEEREEEEEEEGGEDEEDEETGSLLEDDLLDEAGEAAGSEQASSGFDGARGDTSSEDEGGLRRRHVPPLEAHRRRTSDEEDENEELAFAAAAAAATAKADEKRGFSMNKCMVGALVLLCLGSLFLSDDSAELNDGEQTENWPSDDSQSMKVMLNELAQENRKISELEAKLHSQKEELDLALAAAVKGDGKATEDLERDNARMKDELSSLPALKEELRMLRARVTELSELTVSREMATTTETHAGGRPAEKSHPKAAEAEQRSDPRRGGGLKDQLQRQRVLLEESKRRLEAMKTREGGDRRGVREDVEKIQRSLWEHVETLGSKKREGRRGNGDGRGRGTTTTMTTKEDKKRDHRDAGVGAGRAEDKDARTEGRERKQKPHKQTNSHKEAWRKHQGEWESKKAERRMDREERRRRHQEPVAPRPAAAAAAAEGSGERRRLPGDPRRPPRHYDHERFWRRQGEKLRRKLGPPSGCGDAESCAAREALYPVELPEFEELLEGYLSKLEGAPPESREALRRLTAEFFRGGVFVHDRLPFGEFAEDVADVLEDMADLLEGDDGDGGDALEEEMEEFEREALWKFSATA